MRYISVPNEIEANQFLHGATAPVGARAREDGSCYVVTIHGQKTEIAPGDWIILEPGSRGEFAYPCKPDVFERRYRKAEHDEKCIDRTTCGLMLSARDIAIHKMAAQISELRDELGKRMAWKLTESNRELTEKLTALQDRHEAVFTVLKKAHSFFGGIAYTDAIDKQSDALVEEMTAAIHEECTQQAYSDLADSGGIVGAP